MLDRKTLKLPLSSTVPAAFFEEQERESLIEVTLQPGADISARFPFTDLVPAADDLILRKPTDTREQLAAQITSSRRFAEVSLRETYGEGLGQRLLLSRRLCEAGTRFIEVSHYMNFVNGTGWDTHNAGHLNQHLLIQELDKSLTALMRDLESRKMLDKTLIIINSEFGRPAQFDSGGGRGHYSKCFSVVLAGGGMNHTGAWGVSDELAMQPAENPVSVPDAFATILACLQIDPTKNLYDGNRPVPITDQGKAINKLLS